MKIEIVKYQESFRSSIIEIWEQSVRATHHFLKAKDIEFFKSFVLKINFEDFKVFCALNDKKEVIGFLAVADDKLEMLFLKPEYIGKGIGRKFTTFAINTLEVTKVDVNEDNLQAVDFYKKFGFKVYDRRPTDDTGKPFPILKMKR